MCIISIKSWGVWWPLVLRNFKVFSRTFCCFFHPSVTAELNFLTWLHDALGNILYIYSWAVRRVCNHKLCRHGNYVVTSAEPGPAAEPPIAQCMGRGRSTTPLAFSSHTETQLQRIPWKQAGRGQPAHVCPAYRCFTRVGSYLQVTTPT